MPQPLKYSSHAERQAAYRKRQREILAAHWDDKGLPPLPGNPANPNRVRWEKAMCLVEAQIVRVQAEMEAYYDERSERWQQSDRAEEFQQKLDDLTAILELVTEWIT